MAIELHTDRLRKETNADEVVCAVLQHDVERRNRLITIDSIKGGKRTVQTIAYTFLMPHRWAAEVKTVDRLLKNGGLMGETFRRNGFTIRQNRLVRVRLPLLSRAFADKFSCSRWRFSEVEVYEFWASSSLYGFVVEIKNPATKHALPRKSVGLHSLHRHLGVTTKHMFDWLDGVRPMPNVMHLALAHIAGVITSFYLYLRARVYGQRGLSQAE